MLEWLWPIIPGVIDAVSALATVAGVLVALCLSWQANKKADELREDEQRRGATENARRASLAAAAILPRVEAVIEGIGPFHAHLAFGKSLEWKTETIETYLAQVEHLNLNVPLDTLYALASADNNCADNIADALSRIEAMKVSLRSARTYAAFEVTRERAIENAIGQADAGDPARAAIVARWAKQVSGAVTALQYSTRDLRYLSRVGVVYEDLSGDVDDDW